MLARARRKGGGWKVKTPHLRGDQRQGQHQGLRREISHQESERQFFCMLVLHNLSSCGCSWKFVIHKLSFHEGLSSTRFANFRVVHLPKCVPLCQIGLDHRVQDRIRGILCYIFTGHIVRRGLWLKINHTLPLSCQGLIMRQSHLRRRSGRLWKNISEDASQTTVLNLI